MDTLKIVITDEPNLTGYLHGTKFEERRKTSEPEQQQAYEKGYRKGCKDSYKIRAED